MINSNAVSINKDKIIEMTEDQKILFGVGASVASFLFFFVIGYLSKYLSHYAQNEKIWKIINSFIIGFMSLLTIYVILETIN